MIESTLVAAALVAGLDIRTIGLVAVAVFLPFVAALLICIHVVIRRARTDTSDAVFCQSVARELRSGSSLRGALFSSAPRQSSMRAHLAEMRPLSELSPVLSAEFDLVGQELISIVEAVASSGAPSAELFDEIADLALAQLEIAEDIRVATAPARASSFVLIGLPVAYLSYQIGIGRIETLLGHPAQQLMTMAGWGLVLLGVAASLLLVRKASHA